VQGDAVGSTVARSIRGARRPRRGLGAAAMTAFGLLLVAGCQSPATTAQVAGAVQQQIPQAKIAVEPAPSTMGVRPDATVKVTATQGKFTSVVVTDSADVALPGSISAEGRTWSADAKLRLDTNYWVRATAVDAHGLKTDEVTVFSTIKPKSRLTTSISPLNGQTVGVGMPIVVRLSDPVQNRAEVERGLTVTSSRPIEGSWRWISDDEVHFRPRTYWPAYTDVTLKVALAGVEAGNGVWGTKDRTVHFTVGASMVSIVDVNRLHMKVYRNGKLARNVPVTTGKAGFLTRNGIKVVSEKHVLKVMDASTIGIHKGSPEYYRLEVPYALRVSNSGEFVHAAPWSVASQGGVRVSHGCVGMSMANAIWLFRQTHIGDVVQVVGSSRHLEPGNGWTDWNVPWSTWLEGSAL
jgi:lipoprotein-anchoring transpeptidase ErfK/SrfK